MSGVVMSKDGTPIAYEQHGSGSPVILVGGGLDDGSENAALAVELAQHGLAAVNYARRGRGNSGDTPPYAVERELEDIDALITEAGGTASLYGVSSGGALALECAAAGLAVDKVVVYEVPYNMADDWPPRWRRYVEELATLLAADRPSDALSLFMRVTGASDEDIDGAQRSPFWPAGEALAHTLAYDAACLGDGQPPTDRLANVECPVLVATGEDAQHPGAPAWVRALEAAADAIAAAVRNARREIFEGQSHVADPAAVAPLLARFFAG
jgi:pimeloyl-ACP methyl ester carboxylesterase